MNTANDYYRKHYGGGVAIGATPLDEYSRQTLGPGMRYSLVREALARNPPTGGLLAEIGCSGGEALLILSGQYHFDRIVGIDVAVNGSHPSIEFMVSNLDEKWPFRDSEVDILIGMMIIEHLYDPFHSFSEIKRVLARNGSAYINLPLVTGLKNRIRILFGMIPTTSRGYDQWMARREWDGNHLHYFSLKSIKDLAEISGLRVTEVRGVGPFQKLKNGWPELFANEITFCLEHNR